MMKLQTPKTFFFLFLIGFSTCINLNCEYKNESILGQYLNICHGQNDLNIIDPNTEISKINETILTVKLANHITGLSLENKKTQYLPSNLGGKFKNLMALRVKNGRVKELIQEDLKSLSKLRYLNLDENDITSLNNDVFKFNDKLELIWFSNNKISSIGLTVFDHLTLLSKLDLTKNQCISKRASHASSVPTFLQTIKQNCSNFGSTTLSNGQGLFIEYSDVDYDHQATTTKSILNRGNLHEPENVDMYTLAILKAQEELEQSKKNIEKLQNEISALNGDTTSKAMNDSETYQTSQPNLELEQTKLENSMLKDDLKLLKAQLEQQKRSASQDKVQYDNEIKVLKLQIMEKDEAVINLKQQLKTCKEGLTKNVEKSTERIVVSIDDADYY